jgi:hypothetical protein
MILEFTESVLDSYLLKGVAQGTCFSQIDVSMNQT